MMTRINKPQDDFHSLQGQLLLAMPMMDDMRFEEAVIYIYHHSQKNGAFGLVINRPMERMSLNDVVEQLNMKAPLLPELPTMLMGGPDQITRGFILHSTDYRNDETTLITPEIAFSSTQQALVDLLDGQGPKDYLVALGCASWAPGQLEDEIGANIWLTANGTTDLVFNTPFEKKWHEALRSIGITPAFLSLESGNV